MACFTESIVAVGIVSLIKKKVAQKEKSCGIKGANSTKISWATKLGWLITMLWGGIFLLAIEHMWHGEIVPFPPFLTAMNNPEDTAEMLYEILTIGTMQVLAITMIWGVMVILADRVLAKFQNQNLAKLS